MLPWWLSGKESACNAGDPGLIPGLERFPGEGNGNPLQYSCLENPMDRGVWWATVHGVTKESAMTQWLTDHLECASLVVQLGKNPPTMQKTQVWSLGGEDPWRRKWQPSPVSLSRKCHGQRSLAGYSPWGCKESDMTKWLTHTQTHFTDEKSSTKSVE